MVKNLFLFLSIILISFTQAYSQAHTKLLTVNNKQYKTYPINSTETSPRWMFVQNDGNGGVWELSETEKVVNSITGFFNKSNERQLWRFERVSANTYKIFNKGREGSFVVAENTIEWDEAATSENAAVFTIVDNKIKVGENFLYTENNTSDLTFSSTDGNNTNWMFIETMGTSTAENPSYYQFQSDRSIAYTPTVIYEEESTNIVRHNNNVSLNSDAHMWRIEAGENGYKFINKKTGRAIKRTGNLGDKNGLTTVETLSDATEFILTPDNVKKGLIVFYEYNSKYNALDFWGNDLTLGLFQKNENKIINNWSNNQCVFFRQAYHNEYDNFISGEINSYEFIISSFVNPPAQKLSAFKNAIMNAKCAGTVAQIEEAKQALLEAYKLFVAPVISPNGATNLVDPQEVTLTPITEGGKIYYTTDGTVPTETSTEYTAPFSVSENTTVKAIFVKDGFKSEVVKACFNFVQTEYLEVNTKLITANNKQYKTYPINSTETSPRWMFVQNDGNGGVWELSETGKVVNSRTGFFNKSNERQLWRFERVSANTYKIFNKGREGSFIVAENTIEWDEAATSKNAAVFTIVDNKIKVGENFLYTENNTSDLTFSSSDENNTNWIFIETMGTSTAENPLYYQFNSCRTIGHRPTIIYEEQSNNVIRHSKETTVADEDNRLWRIEVGENGYKFINKKSGRALKMGVVGSVNNLNTTDDLSQADEFVLTPDDAKKGLVVFYKQGTEYYAFDFNSAPKEGKFGEMGIFSKTKKQIYDNWTYNQCVFFRQLYHNEYDNFLNNEIKQAELLLKSLTNPPAKELAIFKNALINAKYAGTIEQIEAAKMELFKAYKALVAPIISPKGGMNLEENQTVTITSSLSAAGKIYYTTDGTTPTSASTEYKNPFEVSANTTVKAVFIIVNGEDEIESNITEAEFTFTAIDWIGKSYIKVGEEDATWFNGSGDQYTTLFNGANLGELGAKLVLEGEVQVHKAVEKGVSMSYKIDDNDPVYVELPKTGDEGDNSKHTAKTTIDISALPVGNHTISVCFKAELGGVVVKDNNSGNKYVANFKTITTGIHENKADDYVVRVNNRTITVDGVKDFEVFSVTGQIQNPKSSLIPGVYIVKINDFVKKVVVK